MVKLTVRNGEDVLHTTEVFVCNEQHAKDLGVYLLSQYMDFEDTVEWQPETEIGIQAVTKETGVVLDIVW